MIVLKKQDELALPYSLLLRQASPFLHAKVGELIWYSLAYNVIEELPASLCNLVQLKCLCLDSNQVKQIPNGLLKDCKSLQNISLHNNPISVDEFQLMEELDLEDCPEKESLGHGFL